MLLGWKRLLLPFFCERVSIEPAEPKPNSAMLIIIGVK